MSAADGQTMKIVALVIEDDSMQLMAMQMLLESWGYDVLPASSADAAARVIADGGRPDLIVSDFRLPGNVSGIDAVAQVRQTLGRDLPAILQTGDTDPALARDAAAHGFALLHKPYDPTHLRTLIASLVGRG
jgi:CheY-like chemotaxis protein